MSENENSNVYLLSPGPRGIMNESNDLQYLAQGSQAQALPEDSWIIWPNVLSKFDMCKNSENYILSKAIDS